MKCSSCDKQKHTLKPKKSRLIKSMNLLLCETCEKAGMEPRYIIVLSGRADPNSVAEYIRKKKYIGRDILASELMR